ncbi:hypothetical protein [Streptomyces sp. NPDC047065]|uniref:arsenate reductase/protein-tyrosine-phosphatase family protein n=1 Tax=Streptomyces sp. NPDC047065 TaxID=3154606 RepID=UPI0033D15435
MPDAAAPSVLFVCVHNAGRSQMAAAFLTRLAGDRVQVRSAGSTPAAGINPAVVAAMAEVGIDIAACTGITWPASPRPVTPLAMWLGARTRNSRRAAPRLGKRSGRASD